MRFSVVTGGHCCSCRMQCAGSSIWIGSLITGRGRDLGYELGSLLAVVAAATECAGHDEVAVPAQRAADVPEWVLTVLGAKSADNMTITPPSSSAWSATSQTAVGSAIPRKSPTASPVSPRRGQR